jgi:hypothetical protein
MYLLKLQWSLQYNLDDSGNEDALEIGWMMQRQYCRNLSSVGVADPMVCDDTKGHSIIHSTELSGLLNVLLYRRKPLPASSPFIGDSSFIETITRK